MADKEIKDYCKNCDVEPPAMKFKCPECEHNPNNENNFTKDINAPHKEQIIIDGVNVSECRYYKESLNLGYMRIDSCKGYGFCIHNLPSREFVSSPKYDIPRCHGQNLCYYKQLARKTAECEKLKAQLEIYSKMLDNPEFKIALTDVRTGEREVWRKLGNKAQRDKQALDEIEKYFLKQCEIHKSSIGDYAVQNMCEQCEIKKNLDIISKAKDINVPHKKDGE